MEKYGFVYIWFDRKHIRYYVGCHWGFENDGYVCSSPWMRQAYKHRPYDFKRRVLKTNISSREQTYVEEQKWLNLIKESEIRPNSSNPRYYNLNIKNNNIWSKYDEHVKTTSEKISKKTKEAMHRPEIRQKYLNGLETRDNRSSDLEVLEKRRSSMKETMAKKFPIENRKHHMEFGSEEYRNFMREHTSNVWQSRSEENKQVIAENISKGLLGKQNRLGHINTEEHRAKISQSLKGKKFSEERKEKLRKPRKQKWTKEQKIAHSERIKRSWEIRKQQV